MQRLRAAACIDTVVVAVPPGAEQATAAALGVMAVAGGQTREQSVRLALAALPPGVDIVLIHDAARPLVSVTLIESVVLAVREGAPAVVPGLPVIDTIKQVDARGVVVATPPRSELRAIQTPQGFRREVLERAYAEASDAASLPATDDAGLVERIDEPVLVVPGSPAAFKVTHAADLEHAAALLRAEKG